MLCKRWSLLVVWLAALCLTPWGIVHAEPGWDTAGVERKASELFKKDDFAGLEAMVVEIKKKGYDIRQTYPELSAFYSIFTPRNTEGERQWLDRQTKLEGWSLAIPDSLSAKIVQADWYVGYAWKARGTGFAKTVTSEGWQLLAERLAKAAEILESVPPEKIDDPEYYRLWITTARGQGLSSAKVDHFFTKGTEVAKEFYPLYTAHSIFLLPRWYGDQEACARFAADAAKTFPGDKGEALYAWLVREEARWYGEDYFTQSPADYERVKNAYLAEGSRTGPTKFMAQNNLCYLAAIKGDKETAKRLFLELGYTVDTQSFGGMDAFLRLRKESGAQEAIDKAWTLEQSGDLAEAEKTWTSFHPEVETSPWLLHFYQRQGMEAKLRANILKSDNYLMPQILDAAVATANPDILANLARLSSLLGNWDKAEEAAQAFDRKRPWNLTGKNTLLLCAVRRGDKERAEAVRREIVALKTDRPAYQAAQSILSGAKTWEEVRGSLIPSSEATQPAPSGAKSWAQIRNPPSNNNQYLCQAATAIAVFYLSQDNVETARTVLEEVLAFCPDNTEKAVLGSLLHGSIARSMNSSPKAIHLP